MKFFVQIVKKDIEMKSNWKLKPSKSEATDLIARLLAQRNIFTSEDERVFFDPDYDQDMADPFLLSEMDLAVKRIIEAGEKKERVCIFSDYDADGVTSAVMLTDFFNQLGIDNFCYIPNRNQEGYGLNFKALDYIKEKGAKLVVTADCGISNKEESKYCQKLGMDLIITDHHYVPAELPSALAIINPGKKNDQYPFKELAGVGVAFKLVQAIAKTKKDYPKGKEKWFLDLVAVGTIADCVSMVGENRILAKFGLMVLAKTKRPGFQQMFQVGKMNIDENNLPNSHQVSFQIAPRINAAGRMDHANLAFGLLGLPVGKDAQARAMALDLEEQNKKRQKITNFITGEVERRIASYDFMPKIIIEKSPGWDLGILGLAAGKLASKFFRPVILLSENKDVFKGSCRSIESFNMIEALERNTDFLLKYGGHSQAAGLEVTKANFQRFKKAMIDELEGYADENFVNNIYIDAEIKPEEITIDLVKKLSQFEPFGIGNTPPVFLLKNAQIIDKKTVGNGEGHLKIWIKVTGNSENVLEGIGFGLGDRIDELQVGRQFDIVCSLEENLWNGCNRLQLMVIDFE